MFGSHSLGFPSTHDRHIWYYGKAQNTHCLNLLQEFPSDANFSQQKCLAERPICKQTSLGVECCWIVVLWLA